MMILDESRKCIIVKRKLIFFLSMFYMERENSDIRWGLPRAGARLDELYSPDQTPRSSFPVLASFCCRP